LTAANQNRSLKFDVIEEKDPDIESSVAGSGNYLRHVLSSWASQRQHRTQHTGDEECQIPAAEGKMDVSGTSTTLEGSHPGPSPPDPNHKSQVSLSEQPTQIAAGQDSDRIDERNAGVAPYDDAAPNISLNIYGGTKYGELLAGALFGTLSQFGVLVFCGFSIYHPTFRKRFPKGGGEVPRYGYPIMALGTILLVIGMMLCSLVVDKSTDETKYILRSADGVPSEQTSDNKSRSLVEAAAKVLRRNKKHSRGPELSSKKDDIIRVLWLQKSHTVSDQVFDSFILFGPYESGPRDHILTSRRAPDPSGALTHNRDVVVTGGTEAKDHQPRYWIRCISVDRLKFLTLLGVSLGLSGYILQFEGLRAMNWSASIAQLVCMFLLTLWRAWVRRGLIAKPIAKRVLEEHEMDCLSILIASSDSGNFWPTRKSEQDLSSPSDTNMTWEVITAYDNVGDAGLWFGVLDGFRQRSESPSSSSSDDSFYRPSYTIHYPSTQYDHYMLGNSRTVYEKVKLPRWRPRRIDKDSRRGSDAVEGPAGSSDAFGTESKAPESPATPAARGPAARAMAVRQRLGYLTYFVGPMSTLAIAVSDSVEAVMRNQSLFDRSAKGRIANYRKFAWTLKINLGDTKPPGEVQLCIEKNGGTWEMNPSQVDAVLSLWLYHFRRTEKRDSQGQVKSDWLRQEKSTRRAIDRIIASREAHESGYIKWWMGDLIDSLTRRDEKCESRQLQARGSSDPVTIGFLGVQEATDRTRSLRNKKSRAHDTFSDPNARDSGDFCEC
jgi:hypothetical protein